MRRALRLLALAAALLTLGAWLFTGAHRGWTKTRVTVMETEPVTGLEFPVEHRRLVLGLEWLGAGLALAVAATGVSFFCKTNNNPTRKDTVA